MEDRDFTRRLRTELEMFKRKLDDLRNAAERFETQNPAFSNKSFRAAIEASR